MSSSLELSRHVKSLALALGFDLAGIAGAEPGPDTRFVRDWVDRGLAGRLDYVTRRLEERVDPARVLPGVRSVVAVALTYGEAAEEPASDARSAHGRVARYARGDDYHEVLVDRLRALETAIRASRPERVETRAYVDTGPVLERVFAARAGLGWQGKNTCLIHPRLGSYLFLGVVLCDVELAPDEPEPDHCGTCRACLDACPTDAFPEPYVLDATRCIAYTTIEDPGPVPEPLRVAHGDWLFGCDVCQEVCPWNAPGRRPPLADPLGLRERLAPRPGSARAALADVLELDEPGWLEWTRRSPVRRARWRGMMRNALIAAGNSGDGALRPSVERHAEGADAELAEQARWALARLDARASPAS